MPRPATSVLFSWRFQVIELKISKCLLIVNEPPFLKRSSGGPTDVFSDLPAVDRGTDASSYNWNSLQCLPFCQIDPQVV